MWTQVALSVTSSNSVFMLSKRGGKYKEQQVCEVRRSISQSDWDEHTVGPIPSFGTRPLSENVLNVLRND